MNQFFFCCAAALRVFATPRTFFKFEVVLHSGASFMVQIGYAAHHEQYAPLELLENAARAEQAGFDSIWASDHFHPWIHSHGQNGFAWVWMASAAERTKRVRIGTAVTCPILRYNPAIVAQAFATLGSMYPGRIALGLGTGEPLNEMPVGCEWPSFKERAERIEEAIQVISELWTSERVTFRGKYYSLLKATLYTRPEKKVSMYVAGIGSRLALIAGKYADGFITSGTIPMERYSSILFPALEKGARLADRDPASLRKVVEVFVSYAETFDKALASARSWAAVLLPIWWKYPIYDPIEIEACGDQVGNEQLARMWCISDSAEDHIRNLERFVKAGFDEIYISSTSPDEKEAIDFYGKNVLPYLEH
jgi:coenzyme F420-dependent glucose-6-phosphate dehydrogenase